MGRSARFDQSHFLRAARAIMAEAGPRGLTVQKIAARAGATTGSVYHRFESREEIAAEAWIEAAEHFQSEFAASLHGRSVFEIMESGALHTPKWSRKNPVQARVLLRLDAAELKKENLPEDLQKRIHALAKDLRKTMLSLLKRLKTRTGADRAALLQFLLVDMPLSAVKPHLKKNQKPPAYVDVFILNSLQGFQGELK